MKTIEVTICSGTTCYVMGASQLFSIKDILTSSSPEVIIKASTCLGVCKNEGSEKAPFVKIKDEIIEEATNEKILRRIRELLKEE